MSKFKDLAETLFKAGAGEGAHGGHIVGHTRSGKPIYGSSSHPSHNAFTSADHTDAMNQHHEIWSKTQDKIGKIKTQRPNWNPPKEITGFLQHHHTQMAMHQNRASTKMAKPTPAKSTVVYGKGISKHPYHTPQNIHKGLNDIEVPFAAVVVVVHPDRKQILLGKRSKDDKGWESPAGHADIGERPEDVAIRECFEEFNVPLKESQLEHLPIMYKKDMTPIHCFMAVTTADQIKNISCDDDPSQEHHKWKWFELNGELPDAMEDSRFNVVVHAKMALAGIIEMGKSFVPMDEIDGGAQMHTTEFAQESEHGSAFQNMIESRMRDYGPADVPVLIPLDGESGLYLVRVDDGVYSGFVKKIDSDGLQETVANIEKMTIPSMVQFLRAKQLLHLPKVIKQAEDTKQLKLVLDAITAQTHVEPMMYVSMDGDNIGNRVAQAEAENDESKLQEISSKINAGQIVFATWAGVHGGRIIEAGGDEALAKIPMTASASISFFCKEYERVVGATVTVGTGFTISESTKARELGKLKGKNRIENFGAKTESDLMDLLKPKSEAQKILDSGVIKLLKGAALPIGSIRVWNGQNFRKEASGHWSPIAGGPPSSASASAPSSIVNGPKESGAATAGPGGNAPDASAAPSKAPDIEGASESTREAKPEVKHLKHLLPREGMGGHVTAHSRDLKNALKRGPVSIISGGKNNNIAQDRGMTDEQISQRTKKLEQDLKDSGLKYMKVKGKYNGGSEDSFLVFHADPKKMNELGKKYNQDSVIHSEEGENKLHFTTGENEGLHHKGKGHEMVPDEAKDNFTEVTTSDGKKMRFNLGLDFGKLHGKA